MSFFVTAYPQDHSSSWFQFRIVMADAESKGMIPTNSTVCNYGTTDMVVEGEYLIGVGFEHGGRVSDPWTLTPSVLEEIKSSFNATMNGFWDSAMGHELTFNKETVQHFSVTLRPRKRITVNQLVGTYGPYIVRAPTNVMYSSEDC